MYPQPTIYFLKKSLDLIRDVITTTSALVLTIRIKSFHVLQRNTPSP